MIRRSFLSNSSLTLLALGIPLSESISQLATAGPILTHENAEIAKFKQLIEASLRSHELDTSLARNIALPETVLSRTETNKGFILKYVNKEGSIITLTNNKGQSSFHITNV